MKTLCGWMVMMVFVLGGISPAQGVGRAQAAGDTGLVGAWRLVSIGEVGGEMKPTAVKGTLIYTQDGHMSVQLMYPAAEAGLSNEYVRDGYEASFGSYEVDEAAHTVTHHVQGSVTRALVGKALTRRFALEGKRLVITSTRADERWMVVWEHE